MIGIDPPLAGNAMQRLLDAGRQGHVRLAVPDLVVREAANNWASEVITQFRDLERAERRLTQLGVEVPASARPRLEGLRATKDAEIRKQLKDAGAQMPAMPSGGHEAIVERALSRQQPFDSQGKDGYRDALLWETVVAAATEDDVLFVTRDVRAFFDGKPDKGIGPSLRDEAADRCGREDAVALFFNLDEALDEAIRRTQQEQAQRAQRRADLEARRAVMSALARPDFAEEIGDRLRTAVYDAELTWEEVRALLPHRETREIWIDDVEDLTDIKVLSAHQLSDRLLVDLSARMLVSVEVNLPAAVAPAIDEDDALVFSGTDEWGEAHASALRTVVGRFEATFDPDLKQIEAVRLRRLGRSRR